MTLIEALQKLELFSEDLQLIIEEYNYDGYDKLLEKYSLSILNQLKAVLHYTQNNINVSFNYCIHNVYRHCIKIYYIDELNEIFVKNDIECLDISSAIEWSNDNWDNMPEFIPEIEIKTTSCIEKYQNIYDIMQQKFTDRFYKR